MIALLISIVALVIAIWNYLEVREEDRRFEEFYNSKGGTIVHGGRSKSNGKKDIVTHCSTCNYHENPDNEYPCADCTHSHSDLWVPKVDREKIERETCSSE